jgi:hypothetical protein
MSTEASGSETKAEATWLKAVKVIAYCVAGFVLLAGIAEYFGLISAVGRVPGPLSAALSASFVFNIVKGVLGFPVYVLQGMRVCDHIETQLTVSQNHEPTGLSETLD